MNAQDSNIIANIEKAKASNGKFYNLGGKLVLNLNIEKIQLFYKWSETADTSGYIDQITSWDSESLRKIYDSYSGIIDDQPLASIDEIRKLRNQTYSFDLDNKK
jgi:hypothetical protein